VSDLARLSLQPRIRGGCTRLQALHTPQPFSTLHNYPLPQKLDTLFSFIRNKSQVQDHCVHVFWKAGGSCTSHSDIYNPEFHCSTFTAAEAGGRLDITTRFLKPNMQSYSPRMSRTWLDFPAVDWVIQLDCPEDAEPISIELAERLVRAKRKGRPVLESGEKEGMLKRLEQKKGGLNGQREGQETQSVKDQVQNMCFKDSELKYLGQKASYLR